MDDIARWLKDKEALGHSKRGLAQALLTFQATLGSRVERLTITSYTRLYPRAGGGGAEPVWHCRCDCGNELDARSSALRTGDLKSCGRCNRGASYSWSEQLLRRLALSLELEGCIGTYGVPKVVIGVREYSSELVDVLCAEVGLGAISRYTKANGLSYAEWQVTGFDAQVIARAVLPYMVCKRRQTEVVLEFPIGDRRERVTPEMKAVRARCAAETHMLNERGPRESSPLWGPLAEAWCKWASTAAPDARVDLLAWAIEWEGHVGVHECRSADGSRGVRHQLGIGVSQSEHRGCLLDVVKALSGGVGGMSHQTDSREGNAQMMIWAVHAVADAKALARDLLPHMRCKKRLVELITEYPEWSSCGRTPVSEDLFLKRRALALETKQLNMKLSLEEALGGLLVDEPQL